MSTVPTLSLRRTADLVATMPYCSATTRATPSSWSAYGPAESP